MRKFIIPVGLLAALLVATAARAHSWYDPWCCNTRDCQVAPEGSIRAVQGGWQIRIARNQHPFLTKDFEALVPYSADSIRLSEDGRFHICFYPKDVLRCLYIVPGGV